MKKKPKPPKPSEHCKPINLDKEVRTLMSTAAELQTAVDALSASVSKVAAEVAALKATPPVAQNVEQAQLDANTAAITTATDKLNAL